MQQAGDLLAPDKSESYDYPTIKIPILTHITQKTYSSLWRGFHIISHNSKPGLIKLNGN